MGKARLRGGARILKDRDSFSFSFNRSGIEGDGRFWAVRYDLKRLLGANLVSGDYALRLHVALASESELSFSGAVLIRIYAAGLVFEQFAENMGEVYIRFSADIAQDVLVDVLAAEWHNTWLDVGVTATLSNLRVEVLVPHIWTAPDGKTYRVINNAPSKYVAELPENGCIAFIARECSFNFQLKVVEKDIGKQRSISDCVVTFELLAASDFNGRFLAYDAARTVSSTHYPIRLAAGKWSLSLSFRSRETGGFELDCHLAAGAPVTMYITQFTCHSLPFFPVGPRVGTQHAPILRAYFSHHRSGSSWFYGIIHTLSALCDMRVRVMHYMDDDYSQPEKTLAREGTELIVDRNVNLAIYDDLVVRGVHVIRDPRDMLISSYYSHLKSHPCAGWPELAAHRKILREQGKNQGLVEELGFCANFFEDMRSVACNRYKHDLLMVKFEDLIANPYEHFVPICAHLGFGEAGLSHHMLQHVLDAHRFESMSGGRTAGTEDIAHHYRKGIAGDWKNHFTAELVHLFKIKYQDVLKAFDYETSSDW